MSGKEVYRVPTAESLDGVNISRYYYPYIFEHRIDDFRLKRGDDVLIATYPRSGTTWLSQIVSLMLASDDKYESVKNTRITDRVLYLEMGREDNLELPEITRLDTVPPPRCNKTHLPYRLIRRWIDEDNVKTITTTRNPKDTLVSLFFFYKSIKGYDFEDKTWNEFFEHVQAGYTEHGDMYEWLLDMYTNTEKGKICFLKYEDMKADIVTQVKKIADFLEIELSEERMKRVIHDSSIGSMKAATEIMNNEFWLEQEGEVVRKGQSGSWKKFFTIAQNEWFDNKYKKLYEELPIDVHYD